MPARKNKPLHTDKCREKIQTSQLINRLQNHVFTFEDDPDFKKSYMTDSQVRSALGLLKKTLPDLSAESLGADETGKLIIESAIKGLPNSDNQEDSSSV